MIHSGTNATYAHHYEHKYLGYGAVNGLNDQLLIRVIYDAANWSQGGCLVTIWSWYYSPSNGHAYQQYFVSVGYSSHATSLHTVASAGGGVSGVAWDNAAQISGNIYSRDLRCDIPAYYHVSSQAEWTTGLYHTTDANSSSAGYIYVG